MTRSLSPLLLAILFLCGGCADADWKARTLPVSGKVLINGQAHPGIFVILFSRGSDIDISGSRPWGITDEHGFFTLTTYEKGDGCPAGEYIVTLKWPVDPGAKSIDRLSGKFSIPASSKMFVTVNDTTPELLPIELSDVKIAELPPDPPTDVIPGAARTQKTK